MAQELIQFTVNCKGVWSRDTSPYADRLLFTVGKIVVGSVEHPTRSKGEPRLAKAALRVPGINMKAGTDSFIDGDADDHAKRRVEAAFKTWLSWLQPID